MKEGTLVWIVASVGDDALQANCDNDEIVVEPHTDIKQCLYTLISSG